MGYHPLMVDSLTQYSNFMIKIKELTLDEFLKVEMRVGTIIDALEFSEAKKPAYKLTIDFGDHGIMKSSAQITKLYNTGELINKQAIAVVNFPVKLIAGFRSECLVLGVMGNDNKVTLLVPDKEVQNGLLIG